MYELWDVGSGNIIGTYTTLNDLVQAAFSLGQVNPNMDQGDLSAAVMTADEIDEPNHCASCCAQTKGSLHVNPEYDQDHKAVSIYEENCEAVHDIPFEELSDEDKRWFAEGWLERNADNR